MNEWWTSVRVRWQPVALLAAALLAVDLVTRLIARLVDGDDDAKQTLIGLVAAIAVGVVVLGWSVRWILRRRLPRVAGDLAIAIAVGSLLSVVVGPLVSSGKAYPSLSGVVLQFVVLATIAAFGAVFGVTGVMVLGADHTSQSWKRYAENLQARPRRVARR